jgi:hypothetical protein
MPSACSFLVSLKESLPTLKKTQQHYATEFLASLVNAASAVTSWLATLEGSRRAVA